MSTIRDEFEALLPEPVGFRTRYRSEPGMVGHYPWTYADAARRRRKYDRPAFEYEDLYTADQMRAMFDAATERAAKQVKDAFWEGFNAVDASGVMNSPEEAWPNSNADAAIRAKGGEAK